MHLHKDEQELLARLSVLNKKPKLNANKIRQIENLLRQTKIAQKRRLSPDKIFSA